MTRTFHHPYPSGRATSGATDRQPGRRRCPALIALQTELDRAETVVGHDEVPADVVTMNSRVHCREESSGKDYHLTLVYPKDANADEGKISILAPVGSALLGLQVGQHIDWPAPGGKTLKLNCSRLKTSPKTAALSKPSKSGSAPHSSAFQVGLVAQVQVARALPITEQAGQVQVGDVAAVTLGLPALPDDFPGDHANSWSPYSNSENSR